MSEPNDRQSGQEPDPSEDPRHRGSGGARTYANQAKVNARVRERLEDASLDDIAQEVGVSRSTVDAHARGADFSEADWKRWWAWYQADRENHPELDYDQATAALLLHHALLPAFGDRWADAAPRLADAMDAAARRLAKPLPRWTAPLRDAAAAAALPPYPRAGDEDRETRRQQRLRRRALKEAAAAPPADGPPPDGTPPGEDGDGPVPD